MNAKLGECLKKLRLSGMAQTLEVRLQEATANRLDHAEFLELVLADELAVRQERLIARGLKAAGFREQKTLEDFNWDFNRSIKKKQIYDMAAGGFVRQHRDVLLAGPPGVGKSHLVQAIGHQLVHAGFTVLYRSIFDAVRDFLHDEAFEGHDRIMTRYLKPDLLILDDMGLKQLPKRSGEYLFEIIMRRHQLRFDDDDQQPAPGGLGQVDERRSGGHGDPRPAAGQRRDPSDHRQELSAGRRRATASEAPRSVKTSRSAHREFADDWRGRGFLRHGKAKE